VNKKVEEFGFWEEQPKI